MSASSITITQTQLQQITKQLNRIKRLATQLNKKSQQTSQETDDILTATLKIQKILTTLTNKKPSPILYSHLQSQYPQIRNNRNSYGGNDDGEYRFMPENNQIQSQYCNQAVQRINRVMGKLGRFQKKMGLLIYQAEFKRLRNRGIVQVKQGKQQQVQVQDQGGQVHRHNTNQIEVQPQPNHKKTKPKPNNYPNPKKDPPRKQSSQKKKKTQPPHLHSHQAQPLQPLQPLPSPSASELISNQQLQNLDKQIAELMRKINFQQNQPSFIEESDDYVQE